MKARDLDHTQIINALKKQKDKLKKINSSLGFEKWELETKGILNLIYPVEAWAVKKFSELSRQIIREDFFNQISGSGQVVDREKTMDNFLEILIQDHKEYTTSRQRKQSIKNSIREQSRVCMYMDCNRLTNQDCHILQRAKILESIAEKGKVWRYEPVPFPREGNFLDFCERGIRKDASTFTFYGFCSDHDNNVFKSMEVGDFDPYNYKHQLLQSYRALLNEIRIKEFWVIVHQKYLQDEVVSKNKYFDLDYEKRFIVEGMLQVTDMDNYKIELEENMLNLNKQNFLFHTYELPKIPICATAVFGQPITIQIDLKYIDDLYLEPLNKTLIKKIKAQSFYKNLALNDNLYYLNIIPGSNKTNVILGHHISNTEANRYCHYLYSLSEKALIKWVSDVLIKRVETWICSPSFYNNYIKVRKKEILDTIRYYFDNFEEKNNEIALNLFQL